MNRALSWIVSLYFGLSVAHWWHLHQLLHHPPRGLWCGNVISDPYFLLMNNLVPIVAVCVGISVLRRIKARRRPLLPLMVLPMFLGTTVALMIEGQWLLDRYWGLPIHHNVWWFPWL